MTRVYWATLVGVDGLRAAVERAVAHFTIRNHCTPDVVQMSTAFEEDLGEVITVGALALTIERVEKLPRTWVRVYR